MQEVKKYSRDTRPGVWKKLFGKGNIHKRMKAECYRSLISPELTSTARNKKNINIAGIEREKISVGEDEINGLRVVAGIEHVFIHRRSVVLGLG